ncbi:T9SS type A sorting domain-containing protein [bacterium]|nr:T9SS type A sorting domain-containing protein [bacterium]
MKIIRISTFIVLIGFSNILLGESAKCGTQQALQNYYTKGRARQSLDLPLSYGTEHFKLWYDTTGNDAVYPTDTDDDGIPDYIEQAGIYLEHAWSIVIDSLGYKQPLPDTLWIPDTADFGGDARLDVYFSNMGSGLYGKTELRASHIDSICNKATAYIEIQSDMTRLESYADNPFPPLKVTCAHEFFHTVQFAYHCPTDAEYSNFIWWMEATAVFNEEFCYDDINDYYLYLKEFQENPQVPLFVKDAGITTEYGGVIFPIFLEEFYSPDSVRFTGYLIERIWELCEYDSPIYAVDNALTELGSSLMEAYENFTYWRMRTDDQWQPEFFSEGANYPLPEMDSVQIENEFTDNFTSRPLATKYYLLPYTYDDNGIIANLSSSTRYISSQLEVMRIEISQSSPLGGFDLVELGDTFGIAGRWQYRAIAYASLLYSAPISADFSIWLEADDSLSIPINAQNRIHLPFPNPCDNGTVKFPIDIISPTDVSVHIFTPTGENIWNFTEQLYLPDYLEINWNCTNSSGMKVASGIYIYKIEVGSQTKLGKLFILR